MVTVVGAHEAKTGLADILNRVAYRGERIIVERRGKPIAAVVSIEDLQRLEASEAVGGEESEAARLTKVQRMMKDAGLVSSWPTGQPVPSGERPFIKVQGLPISEQIIAERR